MKQKIHKTFRISKATDEEINLMAQALDVTQTEILLRAWQQYYWGAGLKDELLLIQKKIQRIEDKLDSLAKQNA